MNFKQHITALCSYFQKVTCTGEYTIHIKWDDTEGEHHEEEGARTMAEVCINSSYLFMELYISDKLQEAFYREDWREIAETICHEFCHLLTEPLYEAAIPATPPLAAEALGKLREQQTQRICNALMALVPASAWRPTSVPVDDAHKLRKINQDVSRLMRSGERLSKKLGIHLAHRPKSKVVSINRLEPINQMTQDRLQPIAGPE